jgi:hypothetical protein
LVAAQATSAKKDRAVVTGARNLFRTIGGAFGLASTFPLQVYLTIVCDAILNNVVASRLEAESDMSPELQLRIFKSSLQLPDDLTPTQMATIMKA